MQYASQISRFRGQAFSSSEGLKQNVTKLAAIATRSIPSKRGTQPVEGSRCGICSRPRQSLPQPPKRWLTGDRHTNSIQSGAVLGGAAEGATQHAKQISVGTLDECRKLPQHRSGHSHSGAFLLGAGAEVRAQKEARSSREEGEACFTGLQRHYRGDDLLD